MSENNLETTGSNFSLLINDIMTGNKSLSYSSLSKFLQSPKHYKAYITGVKEQTKAMKDGIMFHEACLEPDKFKENYWVLNDEEICKKIGGAKPRSTKVYKEWLSEEVMKHKGEMISQSDYDTFINMSNALRLNTATNWMFEYMTESEQRYKYEHDGFTITIKIDGEGIHPENGNYIFDLKKVADSSFEKVKWDIRKMKYHMQGGIYSNFRNTNNYFLVYIDTSCNITVVKLNQHTLEEGFEMFEFALSEFEKCAELDAWNQSYEYFNGGYINY